MKSRTKVTTTSNVNDLLAVLKIAPHRVLSDIIEDPNIPLPPNTPPDAISMAYSSCNFGIRRHRYMTVGTIRITMPMIKKPIGRILRFFMAISSLYDPVFQATRSAYA